MPLDSMSSILPFSRPEPADATGALLDLLGPIDGLHVLVIGPGSLGAVLALHRRGAASVTALRAGCRTRVTAADAVLVLGISTPGMADSAIADARRAIQPLNSLVLQFAPDAPAALLAHTRQRLTEAGLTAGRTLAIGGCAALLADLPLYGRLKCA